jgi:hypothetical protein
VAEAGGSRRLARPSPHGRLSLALISPLVTAVRAAQRTSQIQVADPLWLRLDAFGLGISKMRILGIVVLGAALAGCAGRAPAPVAVVQPTDRYMDCTAILAEVGADKGLKTTQNVAAGVAGIFIPVLWFGMDFQGTADTEITALQSRQQYLAMLADQKRCGAEPEPPPAPARGKRQAKSSRPVAPPDDAEPQEAVPGKQ